MFTALTFAGDHRMIMVLGEDYELSWNDTGQDDMQSGIACISEGVHVRGPWKAAYCQNRAIVIHETERFFLNKPKLKVTKNRQAM